MSRRDWPSQGTRTSPRRGGGVLTEVERVADFAKRRRGSWSSREQTRDLLGARLTTSRDNPATRSMRNLPPKLADCVRYI